MQIRKVAQADIDAVERLYDAVHAAEEQGKQTIGWIRGVYPVRATAENALERGDLFVLEDGGEIYGTGIIPTDFNGIAGINLVLLEKYIG